MNVEVLYRFEKDFKKLDKQTAIRVAEVVQDLQTITDLDDIPNLRKMQGTDFAYRIRVGDYRIGFLLVDETIIELHRVLHRKEMYRYFP
jgi:mRNA interferase RelE/StbE